MSKITKLLAEDLLTILHILSNNKKKENKEIKIYFINTNRRYRTFLYESHHRTNKPFRIAYSLL